MEPGSIVWATVAEAQRFCTSKTPREYCPGRTELGGDYLRFDTVRGFVIDEATLRDTWNDLPADHPCGSDWGNYYEDPCFNGWKHNRTPSYLSDNTHFAKLRFKF